MRDPYDFTIEVCQVCGAQLNRSGNGRCPVAPEHWSAGGMVVRVLARPDADQDRLYRPGRIPLRAVASSEERP